MAVKGLKQSSETIVIGFSVTESAANTFTQGRVDLQLNPLDNEVFVVTGINLDPFFPDALAAIDTSVNAAITTTSRTSMPSLADSACLAKTTNFIAAAGFVDGGVSFQQSSMETPPAILDYLGIIATNDFFLQVKGTNNLGTKGLNGKMYGYRAVASAATYAALVQSEVLSN